MPWGTDPVVAPAAAGWGAQDAVLEPDMSAVRRHFESVRGAQSFTDFIEAGWQQSVTGLASRRKAPDVALTEDSPWYGRLASSLTTMAGDVPAMLPGFALGAAGGGAAGSAIPVLGTAAGATVGGFAGAGALPAGLRAAMMEAYTKGEITSSSDFIDRALHVSWETGKGGVVGALTGGAGVVVKGALPVATGALTRGAAVTGAEVTTLATVGKALEGQLPEPHDFLDAAVLLGGVKGAAHVAPRLRTIYAVTGKTPVEVLADAKANPKLLEQLQMAPAARIAGEPPMIEIPAEYMPLALRENARAAIPDPRSSEAAAAVAEAPFAEIPQAKGEPARPTHVNYDYLNTTDEAAAALSRLSEVYEKRITEQRRGTVSWEETSAEAGKMLSDTLGGVDPRLLAPREPGTPAGAAEILARKQLVIGAAEDMATRAKAYLEKGADASPEDTAAFLASIERTSMIQAHFLGARAEAGRALNILKSTARDAERVKLVKDVVDKWGKDPAKLAAMIGELDNPAAALKFSRDAVKATTWEKIVEAWKAALLSGPVTHVANIMGNTGFLALRPVVDAVAAGAGLLRRAPAGERVGAMEPFARVIGNLAGTFDGLKQAGIVFRTGEQPGKAETHRKAIEGVKGEVIRLPFRALSAADQFFKTLVERGELYTLTMREAAGEGLNPLSAEYRARVNQLALNPSEKIMTAMKDAGERFTFNKELGDFGQKVQAVVRAGHLEWLMPFIRTPANVMKEMVKMTPFAPLVKEWREAFAKGGAERDKAVAELATGTSIMTAIFVHALEGDITGQGPPDQGKKRVLMASGWQPYSIKVGDTYYSYERLQPVGTLIGIAADIAEVWDHTTDEEADKIPTMLAVAFANAVTNQTWLQGVTKIAGALDPHKSKSRFFEGLAGSLVPGAVSQAANMRDPLAREVNGMADAIRARIPGEREKLLPKRDVFGEPEPNKDRLLGVMPITKKTETDDKVRSEAARLGISAGDAPKKVHVGRGTGKPGDVKLEPEQRDIFTDVGGHLAYEIMAPLVNSPAWDALPPLVQKRAYAKAFMAGHKQGALAAVPPELRASLIPEITQKIANELVPGE